MTKPHAEIRKALVTGIRDNPGIPSEIKAAAELIISTIDHIERHGEDEDSRRAFHQNYERLIHVAGNQ